MNTLEIIIFLLINPIFGKFASEYLIGDKTFYYYHYDSDFGPFNVFKGKDLKDYSIELEKKNVRLIFYCIVGGVFTFIFAFIHVLYTTIKKWVNTIKWAFT